MRRTYLVSAVILLCQIGVAEDELSLALAQVVDARRFPAEAASLETIPYRFLLERVRMGPDERTLVNLAVDFSYDALRLRPDPFRGKVVFATGIIAQIKRVKAPGVGRTDRNEVHAGILGRLADRGQIELWAFRALRRPGDAILYVGDRVHLSGYFLKNAPIIDAMEEVHWVPQLVVPWPTYYGKWAPANTVRRIARGRLPAREFPHEQIRTRPVVDFHGDGTVALNGIGLECTFVVAALRRFGSHRPGRVAVARIAGPAAKHEARTVFAAAGMQALVAFKDAPLIPPVSAER